MAATIIDGKAVSANTRVRIKAMTEQFVEKYGRAPGLAVIIAGEDPASHTYVKNKITGCAEVGFRSFHFEYPQDVSEQVLIEKIKELAADDAVDGILVQLPLPKHLDEQKILSYIPDAKDVDGFSPDNVGRLSMGIARTVSCTPLGVMELLKAYEIDPAGKRAVVIGRSNTVGKPMAMLLINANATVTVCHSKTVGLKEITREADIVVVAIGRAHFLSVDMVKSGAVVIDVGINRVDGKLTGDADFETIKEIASYITPVPGGVGPMTISMLLYNTLKAAEYAR